MKVRVKTTKILTLKGVNHYGGSILDVSDDIYRKIHESVESLEAPEPEPEPEPDPIEEISESSSEDTSEYTSD